MEEKIIATRSRAPGVWFIILTAAGIGTLALACYFLVLFLETQAGLDSIKPPENGAGVYAVMFAGAIMQFTWAMSLMLASGLGGLSAALLCLGIVFTVRYFKTPKQIIKLQGDTLHFLKGSCTLKEFACSRPLKEGAPDFELNGGKHVFHFVADERKAAEALNELRGSGK